MNRVRNHIQSKEEEVMCEGKDELEIEELVPE